MKCQFKIPQKLNNKGLSMVELLLSIMILMIVSTSLFSFMIISGRMFNRSNEEVDMQSEAQIMKNYMNDLITDAAKGLEYVKKEDAQKENYGSDRCLIIYGDKVISYMAWIEESKQVHLLEKKNFTINADGSYSVNFGEGERNVANWPLLAEGVSKFDCNVTTITEEHRIFSSEMGFENGGSDYATTHTITLRNDIFFVGMAGGNVPGASSNAHITGITLAPGFTDIAKGGTVEFTHAVSAVGNIDTGVTYSVEGNNSTDTRMESNVLHVGGDETAAMLTVICRANIDANVSSTAIVNVTNVSSIAIVPVQKPNYKEVYYYPGSNIDFTAKVEGNFISTNGSAVTWEITDSKNEAVIKEFTETTCKVALGPSMNHEIILKAISKADKNISREYTIRTADVDIGDLYIEAVGGEYKVKRDGNLQLRLLVSGQPAGGNVSVVWSIVNNPLGSKVSIGNDGVLKASESVSFAKKYDLTVQAVVSGHTQGGTSDTVTCKVTIDPVSITFGSRYAIVVSRKNTDNSENLSTNPTRVRIEVKGLNMEDKELRVQQNPYTRGLEHWMVQSQDDYAILALNMTQEEPPSGKSTLRISLKNDSSVFANLEAYFLKYNQFYGGKYVYIPVPGDVLNFITDSDQNGIPDTTSEVSLEGIKYGYTYVVVNDVLYHYYVDKNDKIKDVSWFVRIGNELDNYVYNESTKMYEECTLELNSTP